MISKGYIIIYNVKSYLSDFQVIATLSIIGYSIL